MITLPVINGIEGKSLKKLLDFIVQKNLQQLKFNDVITNIKYIMHLFETILENNCMIKIFWTLEFVTWIFGSYYWAVKAYFQSSLFIGLSLVLGLIAMLVTVFPKAYTVSFSTRKLRFSPVIAIVSFSIITMVVLNSVANAFTLCVILLVTYSGFKVNQISND